MDESVHGRLALGEFHGAVLVPEGLVAYHGVGLVPLLGLALEELVGQVVEGVVAQTGGAYADGLGRLADDAHLGHHVVGGEHPLAAGQLGVLLLDLEVVDEVDVAALGDGEVALLDVQGRICQHEELAPEAEVLLVVGDKLQVVAQVAVHIDRVFDVEAVEGNGRLADGRGKLVLEQADVVVVDVDIGEDLLEHGVEDVARLEHVVDAVAALPLDDGLLGLGVLAVDVLCHGLVYGDGQDALLVVGAGLDKVYQPRGALEDALLHVGGGDVVESEGDLLVPVVLVVVVVLEVGALLGGDDAAHELHGGVVLAAVLALAGADGHLVQTLGLCLELDGEVGGLLVYADGLRHVAHRTDGEAPAVVPLDGELAHAVARHRHVVASV